MKKHILLTVLYIVAAINLSAQSRLFKVGSNAKACNISGNETPRDRYVMPPKLEAENIIDDICRKIGVKSKGFVVQAADIQNAEALIINNVRYIHYNPFYINNIKQESQTYWSMIYVLAHEIGHHVNGHTLNTDNIEKRNEEELDADYFAGCALSHLNATMQDLEKAVSILSVEGDATHPARRTRHMSALRGWEDCKPQTEAKTEANQPKKSNENSDCINKITNDIYFKNMTNAVIRIHPSVQAGWYEQYNYITLEPNEAKAFLDVKVGIQLYAIRRGTGGSSFKDYKNEQIKIKPCIDYSQQPIIIR